MMKNITETAKSACSLSFDRGYVCETFFTTVVHPTLIDESVNVSREILGFF